MPITVEQLRKQEDLFSEAFAKPDLSLVRPLYHDEVVYLSPTVRLYDWPRRIEGVDISKINQLFLQTQPAHLQSSIATSPAPVFLMYMKILS